WKTGRGRVKLAEVSIRRPVFAIMMSLALITLGLFSYRTLGVDLMPRTEAPTASVRVNLPGASPEETETSITKPLEEAVNTISGIDELRANASQGFANINITFKLEKPMDEAVQDVRDKVAQVRLPRDATVPFVNKFDTDSSPILTLAISSDRDPKQLTEIVDTQIREVLETISGVGGTSIFGDRHRQIQILLDADRLNAYNLTAETVRNQIERQNIEIPGGNFIAGPSEIALRTMGRLINVTDFNRIILSQRNGMTVTLADVARVNDAVQEVRNSNNLDGRPAISLS